MFSCAEPMSGNHMWAGVGAACRGASLDRKTAASCALEMRPPEGASITLIGYVGQEYRVPVRHGPFLFVAWDAPPDERLSLIRFE
jgi:hypothetical protein